MSSCPSIPILTPSTTPEAAAAVVVLKEGKVQESISITECIISIILRIRKRCNGTIERARRLRYAVFTRYDASVLVSSFTFNLVLIRFKSPWPSA